MSRVCSVSGMRFKRADDQPLYAGAESCTHVPFGSFTKTLEPTSLISKPLALSMLAVLPS